MRVPNSKRANGRRSKSCLFFAATCALSTTAWGISGTWKTATSDTWTDSAAWTGGLPINAGDSATISATGSQYIVSLGQSLNLGSGTISVSSAAATLSIASGSVLSANFFSFFGGTITGTIDTQSLTLSSSNNGSGGIFLFDRASVTESGAGTSSNLLQVSPSPTVASVSLTVGGTVNANILLTSTRGSANTAKVGGSSSFTNNGTLTVTADPNDALAADNVRSITSSVINSTTGTMQFNTSTSCNNTVTNQGAVNISAGAVFTASTFTQQGGPLIVNGILSANTFNCTAGTIGGTGSIVTSNLFFGAAAPNSGTFVFNQSFGSQTGTVVPVGVTLIAQPSASIPTVNLTVSNTNNGTINLTSAAGVTNTVTLGPTSSSGTLTNNGAINVSPDPNFSGITKNTRTLSGTLLNESSVTISSGVALGGGTFNQAGGTLTVNGILGGSATSTIILAGGTITGNGTINPTYLTLPAGNTASIGVRIVMDNSNTGSSVSGNISSGTTVLAQADSNNSGSSTVSLNYITYPNYPVNNGTLRLTSTYGGNNSVTLNANTFTNQGLLSVDPDPVVGVTNTRTLSGSIVNNPVGTVAINTSTTILNSGSPFANYGTFNVAAGATLSFPTFVQAGGTMNIATGASLSGTTFVQQGGQLNVNGQLTATTFNFNGGNVTGTGTIDAAYLYVQPAANISAGLTAVIDSTSFAPAVNGNIPAGLTVKVQADTTNFGGENARLIFLSGQNLTVNNGTIQLTSTYGNSNSAELLADNLSNEGLISFDPDPKAGVSNTRILYGTILNNQTGTINFNTTGQIGNSNFFANLTNYGTINVAAGVSASASNFNFPGGNLNIPAGATFGVTALVQQGGQLNLNGTMTATTFNYSSGTFNISGGATLSATTFIQQGGQLNVNGSLTAATFDYAGGTFTGTGTIDTPNLIFLNSNPTAVTFSFDHATNTIGGGAVPAGATLIAEPTTSNHSIALTITAINNGTIDLTSTAGVANSISFGAGSSSSTLTNNGTINISPDAAFGGVANNTRTLVGTLLNNGTVNISGGVSVTGGTFDQAGGNLILNGSISNPAGGTFIYAGGTVSGSGTINVQSLSLQAAANASAGAATVLLDSSIGSSITGSIPAGMTALVQADTANSGRTTTTLSTNGGGSEINNGTIRLSSTYGGTNSVTLAAGNFTNQGLLSVDPDPASGVSNTRTITGTIVNNPAGIIAINTTTVFGAVFNSSTITNLGGFNVASGTSASVTTFNQAGGTLNLQGGLRASFLELSGGTISAGAGTLATTSLTIDPSFNGGGTVQMFLFGTDGSTLRLSSPAGWNLPAGTTVNVYQPPGFTSQSCNAVYAFSNYGTLQLSSGTGTTNSVGLTLSGPLTNYGLISIDPDTSATMAQTTRTITGTVVNNQLGSVRVNANLVTQTNGLNITNSGAFNVASGVSATVTSFNQSGGNLTINGTLSSTSLNQLGGTLTLNGALNAQTFNYSGGNVVGSANMNASNIIFSSTIPAGTSFTTYFPASISGTIPSGLSLIYSTRSNALSTNWIFTSSLINNGRIDLTSNGSTGTVQLPAFTFTNNGVLAINPDSTGATINPRYLYWANITNTNLGSIQMNAVSTLGTLSNSGSISIGLGTTATDAGSSFTQQAGTLDIEGVLACSYLAFNGGTVTGAGTLSLGTSFYNGTMVVGSGVQSIGTKLATGNVATLTTNGDLTLNNTLSINSGKMLNKNGAGALWIDGTQSHGAGASLNVSAGSVMIETDPGANLNLLVNTSTVHLTAANTGAIAARNLASLNIGSGGLVSIDAPASSAQRMLLVTGGLTFNGSLGGWHGQLDLTGNDLLVHLGNLANMTDQLHSGFNSGQGSGQGIISSTAPADTTHMTALGILQNDDGTGNPIYPTFDTISSIATDVLIKSTYFGDATLDGQVDGSDYSRIDYGYLNTQTGWANGDFNYDNVIDGSDYTLIDNAFNSQGAALTSSIANPTATITAEIASNTNVPEPSCIFALSVAGTVSLLRRRRIVWAGSR